MEAEPIKAEPPSRKRRWFQFSLPMMIDVTLLAVAFALPAASSQAQTPRSSRQLSKSALPEPPAQARAFTAPADSKLPEKLLSAAAALFDMGLADSRDCQYRAVKIGVGDIWSGDGGTVQVHAWVLRAGERSDNSKNQQFAVAWNGLVYPTIEIGENSDIEADVTAACKADEDARDAAKKKGSPGSFYRSGGAIPERTSVSEHELLPIKVCLLLRLGKTTLAERVWSDITANRRENAREPDDPYLVLAADWLWAMFDRAVTARMRGDDRLALVDLRRLKAVQPLADAVAAKRAIVADRRRNENATNFDFLEPLQRLLADQGRRNSEKPRRPAVTANIKDAHQRIAALIGDLDQVSARQMGQPGGIALGQDPIVQALIHEGDAAVEPLIQCLETDERLTRSVRFWRDFARSRSPIGVHECAYVALSGILGESFFEPRSTGDDLSSRGGDQRKQLAGHIREYWQKYGRMSREERWFAILADDNAGASRWIEAAGNIVRPVDAEPYPSSMFGGGGWVAVPNYKPGERPPLSGDALRKKTNPSVSELLVKRLREACKEEDDRYRRNVRGAVGLAGALALWDGKAHLQDLRDFSEQLRSGFSSGSEASQYLVQPIVMMYLKRAELGDDKALDEYANWVATVSPAQVGFGTDHLFEPMWRFNNRPSIAAAAEKMFSDKESPWSTLVATRQGATFYQERVLQTPVIGLPAVRKQMADQLRSKSKAGTAECREGGGLQVQLDGGSMQGRGATDEHDPLRPATGTKVEFRTCDVIAEHLSWIEGFPRIELYWPEKQRDEAVAKATAILTQYGERLLWSPEYGERGSFARPKMTFPKLDHPATADDVANGLAIFSLDGERRLWSLPSRPLKARWSSLRTSPGVSPQFDVVTGKSKTMTFWRTEGTVWQAEEVRVGGKWVRWFGFVGAGFLGKAPAAEVELELPDRWPRFAKGIEWQLRLPDANKRDRSLPLSALTERKPLRVELHVRNVLGVEQQVPSEWYRAPDAAFRQGLTLRLQRQAEESATQTNVSDQWVDLPPRAITHFTSDRGTRLDVGEELPANSFDLRTLFEIRKPGTYQLQLTGPAAANEEGAVQPATAYFVVKEVDRDDVGR